jgi:hypothetical protein
VPPETVPVDLFKLVNEKDLGYRVARRFIYKQKFSILVNFGTPWSGMFW